MGDWSLGSVSTRALQMLEDVPSSISGTVMTDFAEQARIFTQNYTGQTIGSNTIPEKFQNVITNLTAAFTATRMDAIGADFSYSLGEFRVDKSSKETPTGKQAQFFFDMANMELKTIGKRIGFSKTLG